MLYKISNKIACTIFGEDDENLEEYIYGIELFFSSSVCTVILLILGILTKTFFESVIFILSFSALRVYTGGYHSNSFFLCNIYTISIYITIVLIYKFMFKYIVQLYVSVPIFVLTFALILLLCPIENELNPLEEFEYIQCKIKASIVMIAEIITCCILLYVLKLESIAIIIPTIFFVDVLIALGIIKNRGGIKDGKQKGNC